MINLIPKKRQCEEYIHLLNCIDDLNNARTILVDIGECSDGRLVNPAFQFALIEYAKPYLPSYGVVKNDKGSVRHSLDEKEYVPVKYIDLHKKIITIRNESLAHTDLHPLGTELYITQTEQGKLFMTVRNTIHRTKEIENLVEIVNLIEGSLGIMCKKQEELEGLL